MRRFVHAVAGCLLALAAVPAAHAQKSIRLTLGPGNSSANGYASASVTVEYSVEYCNGEFWVILAHNTRSLRYGDIYWVDGERHRIPAGTSLPERSIYRVTADVHRPLPNGQSAFVSATRSAETSNVFNPHCAGAVSYQSVGRAGNHLPENTTVEQRRAFAASLFIPQSTVRDDQALFNSSVEQAIRGEIRKAAQADKARQDSIVRADRAKRDSIARAEEMRARRDSLDRRARADSIQRAQRVDSLKRAQRDDSVRYQKRIDSSRTARTDSMATARRRAANDSIRKKADADRRETDRRIQQSSADLADSEARLFASAERIFADGRYAIAKPMYESLLYSQKYGALARERLNTINTAAMAEALAQLGAAVAPVLKKINEEMTEHYEGFGFGANYQASYYPGDLGLAGVTIALNERSLMPFMAYAEAGFAFGSPDALTRETGHFDASIGVGMSIPRLGWGSWSRWEPHIGIRGISTSRDPAQSMGTSDGKVVLVTGLVMIQKKGMMRLDLVPMAGKPKFGGAIIMVF